MELFHPLCRPVCAALHRDMQRAPHPRLHGRVQGKFGRHHPDLHHRGHPAPLLLDRYMALPHYQTEVDFQAEDHGECLPFKGVSSFRGALKIKDGLDQMKK